MGPTGEYSILIPGMAHFENYYMTFVLHISNCYCLGVMRPVTTQITPQSPWSYCETTGDKGVKTRREEGRCTVYMVMFSYE